MIFRLLLVINFHVHIRIQIKVKLNLDNFITHLKLLQLKDDMALF